MELHRQALRQGRPSRMPWVLEVVVAAWPVLDTQRVREEVQLPAAVPAAGLLEETAVQLPAEEVSARLRQTGQTAQQLACVRGTTSRGAAAPLQWAPHWSVGLVLSANHWTSHLHPKTPGLHSLTSRSGMQPGRPQANGLSVPGKGLGGVMDHTCLVSIACRPAMEVRRP